MHSGHINRPIAYSSLLLDACGNFCSQKFLRAFTQAAAREGLTYPLPAAPYYAAGQNVPQQLAQPYHPNSIPEWQLSHHSRRLPPPTGLSEPPGNYRLEEDQSHVAAESQQFSTSTPYHVSAPSSEPAVPFCFHPNSVSGEMSLSLRDSYSNEFEEISDDEDSSDERKTDESRSFQNILERSKTCQMAVKDGGINKEIRTKRQGLDNLFELERPSKVACKLKLVLDLDNTLLHASAKSKIGDCDICLDDFVSPEGEPELYKLTLPQIKNQAYYVKFRPGLRQFLKELSEYCDLAIHTNATREYAEVLVAVLDPDSSLFHGRVAARKARDNKKNLDRLYGNDEVDPRTLLILDDRKDVWSESYQDNIIHCGMYDYLDSRRAALIAKYSSTSEPSDPAQNSIFSEESSPSPFSPPPPGSILPSDLPYSSETSWDTPFLDNPLVELSASNASDDDDCEDGDLVAPESDSAVGETQGQARAVGEEARAESPEERYANIVRQLTSHDESLIDFDEQLDCIRRLIIDVAKQFNLIKQTNSYPDVVQILQDKRQKILHGVVVQTAGMYKSESSHPEHGWQDNGPIHRRRLVSLGANVVETTVSDLTHLLAMRATQTIDRVRRERGNEVKYVHALWLHSCESSWQKTPEEWFDALPLLKKYANSPPKKPWVDHWRLAAIHGNSFSSMGRISLAISRANRSASTQLETSQRVCQYITTTPSSHGAQIWGPNLYMVVTYDHVEATKIKIALQEKANAILLKRQQTHTSLLPVHLDSNGHARKRHRQQSDRMYSSSINSEQNSNYSTDNSITNPYCDSEVSSLKHQRVIEQQEGFDDWASPSISCGPARLLSYFSENSKMPQVSNSIVPVSQNSCFN